MSDVSIEVGFGMSEEPRARAPVSARAFAMMIARQVQQEHSAASNIRIFTGHVQVQSSLEVPRECIRPSAHASDESHQTCLRADSIRSAGQAAESPDMAVPRGTSVFYAC